MDRLYVWWLTGAQKISELQKQVEKLEQIADWWIVGGLGQNSSYIAYTMADFLEFTDRIKRYTPEIIKSEIRDIETELKSQLGTIMTMEKVGLRYAHELKSHDFVDDNLLRITPENSKEIFQFCNISKQVLAQAQQIISQISDALS